MVCDHWSFILFPFLCFFLKIYMWIAVSVHVECLTVKKTDHFFFCYDDTGCLYYNILASKDLFTLIHNKVDRNIKIHLLFVFLWSLVPIITSPTDLLNMTRAVHPPPKSVEPPKFHLSTYRPIESLNNIWSFTLRSNSVSSFH